MRSQHWLVLCVAVRVAASWCCTGQDLVQTTRQMTAYDYWKTTEPDDEKPEQEVDEPWEPMVEDREADYLQTAYEKRVYRPPA